MSKSMRKGKRLLFFFFFFLHSDWLLQRIFIHNKGTQDYGFHKPFNLSTAPEAQSKYLGQHPLAMLWGRVVLCCHGSRVPRAKSRCSLHTRTATGAASLEMQQSCRGEVRREVPWSVFLGAQHPLISVSKVWGFTGAEPWMYYSLGLYPAAQSLESATRLGLGDFTSSYAAAMACA